jgi:hypothetical protein
MTPRIAWTFHNHSGIFMALTLAIACGLLTAVAIAADRQATDSEWRQAVVPGQAQAGATDSAAQPAPILVVPGRGGILIASDDPEALDQFQRLLTMMAGNVAAEDPGVTVFYLKYAKAAVVAQTLEAVFTGRSYSPSDEENAPGLDSAGRGTSPRITAEPRLNALIVQSDPADADRIEEILTVLDQRQTPEEIRVTPKPRILAVKNAPAQDIAEVVGQVYSNRMIGGSARGTAMTSGMPQGLFQGPSGVSSEAMERLAALGGGMGGRGGSRRQAEDVPRMSIGVNPRTNSLVIIAPDAMFHEVADLVGQLDQAALRSREVVKVLALRGRDASVLAQALPAMMGDRVRVGQAALAASPSGLAAMRGQGQFGQGQPATGSGPQAGTAVSQGMGAGLAGAGQGPFGAPGMAGVPAASVPTGPQPVPFSPQFPGAGSAPMIEPGPMMGPGEPGSAPGSPGGEFAGPGAPAGPGGP